MSTPPEDNSQLSPEAIAAIDSGLLEIALLTDLGHLFSFVALILDFLALNEQQTSLEVLQLSFLVQEGPGTMRNQLEIGRQVASRLIAMLEVFRPQTVELMLREAGEPSMAMLRVQPPSLVTLLPVLNIALLLGNSFVDQVTHYLAEFDRLMERFDQQPPPPPADQTTDELLSLIIRLSAFLREQLNPQLFGQTIEAQPVVAATARPNAPS